MAPMIEETLHKGTTDLATQVTSLGHVTNSYTNLNQISSSESRPSISSKVLTKLQLQNLT